jgi:anaerobic magnesium-protoporphyrin IX monomethyl ester cyclase
MRCLLVNPFYPLSENPSPPLGLAYLAASLEHAGVAVKILDFVVFPFNPEVFQKELHDFNPDFVGVTSVTMTFDNAVGYIREVKKWNPHCLTVMGGPHVTFCAEETLTAHPELDMIVLGEGEEAIVKIAALIGAEKTQGKQNRRRISGIVFREDSAMVSTGRRSHFLDVDTLKMPARHLLALGRYRALGMPITMTTSRGCPHACIFCVGRKMVGAKVRYRDPVSVVDEMETLAGYGFCQINVADDLFTANEHHCLAVCDEIIRRKLAVKWTSFARVDTVSRTVLERMHEAGCRAVSFGIESANAGILKAIKKGISTDQVITAVSLCNQVGILPHGSFILGLPGETPETLTETLDFGERLKAMGVSFGYHLLAPFPGTEIREKCGSLGITILSGNWADYHANRAIVETPSVSRTTLDEIVIHWENEFNRYLGQIADRIASGDATDEEAWPLVNLERTMTLYALMMGDCLKKAGAMTIRVSSDPEDVFNDLIDRLMLEVDHTSREKLESALSYAYANMFLKYAITDTGVRWQWTD